MKIYHYLYLHIILLSVLSVAQVNTASAEIKNPAADYLVDVGIEHYNRGEVEKAIHEFSKALMLQSDHPKALNYLNRFGIKGGIYRGAQTQASQMADLAYHVKKYRDKLDYVEYQNNEMAYRMDSLKTDNESLVKQRQANDLVMERLNNKLDYFEAKLNQERLKRADMIGQVHNMYQRGGEGTLLLHQRELERDRQNRLAQLDFKRRRLLDRSTKQEKNLLRLATKNNFLREENFQLKSNRDMMMNEVDDYLYVRRNELDKLRDEVVYKEIELAKIQKHLMGKMGGEVISASDQIEIDALRNKVKLTEDALNDAYSQIEKLLEKNEIEK